GRVRRGGFLRPARVETQGHRGAAGGARRGDPGGRRAGPGKRSGPLAPGRRGGPRTWGRGPAGRPVATGGHGTDHRRAGSIAGHPLTQGGRVNHSSPRARKSSRGSSKLQLPKEPTTASRET